jgi:hypothetical protein
MNLSCAMMDGVAICGAPKTTKAVDQHTRTGPTQQLVVSSDPLKGVELNSWLGKKDSNLRMLESKSSALTSLAIPHLTV